jgi:DNA modification methylase
MTPKPNTILHGDCIELMKGFDDSLFDAVITDPPYGVTGDSDDYVATDFLSHAYRVLKKDSALMMFVGQATLVKFWKAAEEAGFTWLNTIIWHYKNTIKRERRKFAIQYDPILYFFKGDFIHRIDAVRVPYLSTERLKYPINNAKQQGWTPNPLGSICGDVWEFPAITTTSPNGQDQKWGHKWQKPVVLFERMIQATCNQDALMLDPFCGSGSSCVAARNCSVDFVGIDIDANCINICENRLSQQTKLSTARPRKRMAIFEE